ncbi:rhamnogalacturonan acetylesterase [Terriglobus sp.]|uniref:rhamnogalacturonan acetylesterase n=1 Tax=Terriglobus sp. TaxID=1889013 RepID=UPI003B00E3F0
MRPLTFRRTTRGLWLRLTAAAGLLVLAAVAMRAEDAYIGPHPAERRAGTIVRVDLVGDSTQTDNAGYGRGLCANLTQRVDCVNMAKGGASTKTYREMGLWDRALSTRPDYMLIQFGHNDQETPEHLPRQVPIADYEANLRRMVTEARAAGIQPVLITPLARRYFEADGKVHSDLTLQSDTMKRVATSMQAPLIDLQALSVAYLDGIGEAAGVKLGITKKDKDGSTIPDKTHLNWQGSYEFGRIVAVELGKAVPALRSDVRKQPATLPPEGELAMRVFEQSPFKIVLTGDSTVATEGGWGPGFCQTLTPNVTCVDLAKNGRSTKSYIDEGLWQQALNEHAQYVFMQFGHNDQKPAPAVHADAEGAYAGNLRRFIHDVRAEGGIPIVVTPLSRRNYRNGALVTDDGLSEYAAAAKRVAAEEHVNVVDLLSLSRALLEKETQAEADTLDAVAHADAKAENGSAGPGVAKPDRTHLNDKGKAIFGRMVADNVIRSEVELGPNVKGLPEGATPALALATSTDGH